MKISQHINTFLGRLLSSNSQWERYEKKYVSLADNVIVVVDEAKERIKGLGVDPSRIHVVSNTINPDHFDFPKQEKDGGSVTMVYGGGINYHRGLQTVIAAMPEAKTRPRSAPSHRVRRFSRISRSGLLSRL